MTTTATPATRTAAVQGLLWGARATDWAEGMEPQFGPLYQAVFDRAGLRRGQRVADLGCGAGLALRLAADRGAAVAGLDAAPALLALARARLPSAELQQGDLEALPFPDASFDLVTGFNAFQYAGNPVNALREARRIAKPGGAVLIAVWGPPEGMPAATVIAALKPLLPAPPPGTPGPFALSDESALRALAARAGLEGGDCFDVAAPWRFESMTQAVRAAASSGVAARAIGAAGAEAVDAAHAAALAPFERADGRVEVGAAFRCLLTAV